MVTKLIITPINMISTHVSGNTKKARDDYIREQVYFDSLLRSPTWDDSKHNNSKIGDMFGFVHNIENKVELFEIIGILNAINRPDYWDIPEHRRRNVLILSRKIRDDTWTRVKQEIGHPNWGNLRGTYRTDWSDMLYYNVDVVYQ